MSQNEDFKERAHHLCARLFSIYACVCVCADCCAFGKSTGIGSERSGARSVGRILVSRSHELFGRIRSVMGYAIDPTHRAAICVFAHMYILYLCDSLEMCAKCACHIMCVRRQRACGECASIRAVFATCGPGDARPAGATHRCVARCLEIGNLYICSV